MGIPEGVKRGLTKAEVLAELQQLFEAAGLQVMELNYRRREVVNRKLKETMTRVWVHAICRRKALD